MTINQNLVDSRPAAKGECFPTPYSSQGDILSSMQLAGLVVESLVTNMLIFF